MADDEARKDRIQGRVVYVQGKVDRDTYYMLRDFAKAHGITVGEAVNWSIRSLLTRAGISLRRTRSVHPDTNDMRVE